MKRIGLALGGGGVRALAHVPALESLDRQGVLISAVAGTSMGAILGALYASGRSGADIRSAVRRIAGLELKTFKARSSLLMQWLKMVRVGPARGGILQTDGFLQYLLDDLRVRNFEDLRIPLSVVTADFWTGEEVVIESGPLLPALKASMAIPGLFAPVKIGGRVLIDGGMVNNVPFDRLMGRCEAVIAVDVTSRRRPGKHDLPTILESVLGMYDILIDTVTARKLTVAAPAVYFRPELDNVMTLDFTKIESVWKQAESSLRGFEKQIRSLA